MKRLVKLFCIPAVIVAASLAATPGTAKAGYGCGYGYGYGYGYKPYPGYYPCYKITPPCFPPPCYYPSYGGYGY